MKQTEKIYLASSWKLPEYPHYLTLLRGWGYEVYDYRDPEYAFKWEKVGQDMGWPDWEKWTFEEYRKALKSKEAHRGFYRDFTAMQWADTCVMLMPSGRSASFEVGWMAGQGKKTIIHFCRMVEPELMFKPVQGGIGFLTHTETELLAALQRGQL